MYVLEERKNRGGYMEREEREEFLEYGGFLVFIGGELRVWK